MNDFRIQYRLFDPDLHKQCLVFICIAGIHVCLVVSGTVPGTTACVTRWVVPFCPLSALLASVVLLVVLQFVADGRSFLTYTIILTRNKLMGGFIILKSNPLSSNPALI